MNSEQFRNYWNDNYPESYPIGYELKSIYSDRWFRIHSLPESKRYAENEEEFRIVLDRQNNLISDIFGDNLDFFILIGLYVDDDLINKNYEDLDHINQFLKVDTIELHKIRPDEYEDEMCYEVFIKNAKWEKNSLNDILKKIANDEIRAMFINPNAKCIIVPYDGGVDLILKNTETRDRFKTKYSDWLSMREDGL